MTLNDNAGRADAWLPASETLKMDGRERRWLPARGQACTAVSNQFMEQVAGDVGQDADSGERQDGCRMAEEEGFGWSPPIQNT